MCLNKQANAPLSLPGVTPALKVTTEADWGFRGKASAQAIPVTMI